MTGTIRLGLRENAAQFSLLVGLNALVGAMVGLERSVLPLVGKQEFGLTSNAAILAFVLTFGASKALTNLVSGSLAERFGRKRVLVAGWAIALPVPLMIGLAPSWGWIVAASYAPLNVVWIGATLISVTGFVISITLVHDTAAHVALEQRSHARDATDEPHTLRTAFVQATRRDPVLRACCQAGLVNNLNDALAWGLAPLYLAANGASVKQIAIVAAAYPVVWGAGQLLTGWLSDHTGRKPMISLGMLLQALALGLLVAGGGAFTPSLCAALLLGAGTAMVYPTLIAAVSDASQPRDRARIISVYRFWRDTGFALGALIAGIGADLISTGAAITTVALLTATSGLIVIATRWHAAAPSPMTVAAEH